MKFLTIIILLLALISCKNFDNKTIKAIPKSIHIPDTTNSYAKLFEYPSYVKKKEITKQLGLYNLEGDTIISEIKMWILGSNYNPQLVYLINTKDNLITISKISYYTFVSKMNTMLTVTPCGHAQKHKQCAVI